MRESDAKAPKRPETRPWKWPLTHSERVVELEELLTMDYYKPNHENIRAAIEYHRGFPSNELCSAEFVNFCDGERSEVQAPPCWPEV